MDPGSLTDDQLRVLADSRNRAVLTVLEGAGRPLPVTELAERLVAREVTVVETAEYEEKLDHALVALHHDRLPRLANAGLVEYDDEATVVARPESTAPTVEWLETLDGLGPHLGTEPDGEAEPDDTLVGVLEGREAILRHGRRLADEADEELFCMYVSTDLLEEECIRRGRAAIDRGVEMCVGSRNPEVRDLTRTRLPGATVWEPQLDWTNTGTDSRVGRLVLADRRTVMLAVVDESTPADAPGETAVVGEGEDHPLVVLVRELLGSRLDHLDRQSEDFRRELPT